MNAAGSNAKLGRGSSSWPKLMSLTLLSLYLTPVVAVVTNIDADHMDTYGHDINKLKQAFVDFINASAFLWKGRCLR